MATRSDQLHSHQFALHRAIAAVALRDPDAATTALRRVGVALFAGVMVAALGLAAVGVYGLLRPNGGDAWREGGSVIIEEETGARFVYQDGVLHPVLNYSSALLILGSADPPSAHVPRASLVGVPRGVPLGIPGAPDLLPAPGELLSTPWTLCSRTAASPSPVTPATLVDASTESVLLVGTAPDGATEPLGQRGVLARDANGALHLIWGERRHAITASELVLAALGWAREMAVPIATAVLNAVPVGADLGRVAVEPGGQPSTVAGLRVGEVYVVQNSSGGRQFGLVRADGLADITQVQADLLIADGANGLGGRPTEIGQALFASAPRAASLIPTTPAAPPATTPELARPGDRTALCATFADTAPAPRLLLAAAATAPGGEIRLAVPAGDVVAPVDWVMVPPGRGVVVEALAGAGAPEGALAFVSDLGQRFPLAGRETLALLGYSGVRPQRLPAALVVLLPAGRALDPATARTPVTG